MAEIKLQGTYNVVIYGGCAFELMVEVTTVEGDLLNQQTDGIVNAWNRNIIPWWLLVPCGVSGAIKKRGGIEPFVEVARFGPIPLGGAVVTGAGRLSFKCIIHVAGINMLWRASEYSIRESVKNAMLVGEQEQIRSLAFPIIGAGSGTFDQAKAERIMLETFEQIHSELSVVLVRWKK